MVEKSVGQEAHMFAATLQTRRRLGQHPTTMSHVPSLANRHIELAKQAGGLMTGGPHPHVCSQEIPDSLLPLATDVQLDSLAQRLMLCNFRKCWGPTATKLLEPLC